MGQHDAEDEFARYFEARNTGDEGGSEAHDHDYQRWLQTLPMGYSADPDRPKKHKGEQHYVPRSTVVRVGSPIRDIGFAVCVDVARLTHAQEDPARLRPGPR